jgi:cell division GTPase FtsZ
MLETSIDGARAVLINITGGPDTSIIDINEAAQLITAAADPEANIIFGAGIDETMDDEVKITVIATGFEKPSFTDTVKPAIGDIRESEEAEPVRAPRSSRYEEEQVSPIFERRARTERERPPRESADTGYEQREQRRTERQQTRRPRVYQDEDREPRNQSRRGFTPDVPSFMKKK